MLKLATSGCWYLNSKTDPRWNRHGRAEYCGGFTMPRECNLAIEDLKKSLGEPPDDLVYGYMKD